jgi:hypothetical protein
MISKPAARFGILWHKVWVDVVNAKDLSFWDQWVPKVILNRGRNFNSLIEIISF